MFYLPCFSLHCFLLVLFPVESSVLKKIDNPDNSGSILLLIAAFLVYNYFKKKDKTVVVTPKEKGANIAVNALKTLGVFGLAGLALILLYVVSAN